MGDDEAEERSARPVEGLPASARWATTGPASGFVGAGVRLREPATSTPLDDGEDGDVPPAVLWAMKYHRHVHFGSREGEELRARLGRGDATVYVIDDGPNRCMVGRVVGTGTDGCTYCLVAGIDLGRYWQCARGDEPVASLFADARHYVLCAVYVDVPGVSNVVEAARYRHADDVPVEYLPGSPPIEFTDPAE
ncbi:MAG: hypothetical protein ACYCU7_03390 [Acidimicrobiales bacterium]